MIDRQKVVIILPAYNAEQTLLKTYEEISRDIVDEVILTDDFSSDRTVEIARRLDLTLIVHDENRGYGGNQKSCYKAALEAGADIIIMLHPDYQYSPKLIPAMAHLVASGEQTLSARNWQTSRRLWPFKWLGITMDGCMVA